ncbi:MAG: hypothetical protein ACLP0J_17900 [Solirubrobacteraceae bacterium]
MFEKHKAAQEEARKAAERQTLRIQQDAELRQFVESLMTEDGGLSDAAYDRLTAYLAERGHINEEGRLRPGAVPPDVGRIFVLGRAIAGHFSERERTLLLKRGEVAYWEVDAHLLKEVTDREFRGASRGISVPLGHAVRYRTGAMRGHMVTIGTHWATADTGSSRSPTNAPSITAGARRWSSPTRSWRR